jgi:PIN domain nuclease of toxin-antitoxin system
VRLLLDTHAFMFAFDSPQNLSRTAREVIEDPFVERYVSVLSLAEIAVKIQIGKLDMPSERGYYVNQLSALSARALPIETAHAFELFHLPLHHRDPFDRMLIAQAKADGLTIITRDRIFSAYDVPVLW